MSGFLVLTVRIAVGGVFLVAVCGKVAGRAAFGRFAGWLAALLRPRLRRPVAIGLIAAEAAVVVLLAIPGTRFAGLAAAAVVLTGFAAAIVVLVRRGHRVPCRCLGTTGTRPMGTAEVLRNLVLAAASVAAVASGPGAPAAPADAVAAVFLGVTSALLIVRLDDVLALFGVTAGRSRP
ncbi:MauE/DoxX family redox-associated membrane protein [Amycolatopsis sp. NPDC026612]|uniref:MauE/DoxX family redox-associated membrane protein n=1 Tax=Amycolatopsis sp. NPDC026612 TaxID=3155466 RepID=UPI0033EF1DF1